MIRKLLATTAIATLVSTGAFAQTTTTEQPAPSAAPSATENTQGAAQGGAGATTEAAPAAQDSTTQAQQESTTEPAATTEQPAATQQAEQPADPETDQAQKPANAIDAQQAQVPASEMSGHLASNLIGETVYNGTGDDAENIGEVNDLVISEDGNVEAIVVGVGGFLGIGEKNVALKFDTVEWAERDGDRWIVVATTEDDLKALEAFDRNAYGQEQSDQMASGQTTTTGGMSQDTAAQDGTQQQDAAAPAASGTTTAVVPAPTAGEATQDTAANQPAAGATDNTQTAAIDRNSLKEVDMGQMSAENLVGTTVYGANDENIGEVGDVVLSQDGKVDAIIIDVGGFLGMGEKPVAVGMDNLQFLSDENNRMYLYTNFSKEQLDQAQAYDEAAYAQSRDQMRLQVQ
jgi:sporulation protein YlmC with PRC-barrel domain